MEFAPKSPFQTFTFLKLVDLLMLCFSKRHNLLIIFFFPSQLQNLGQLGGQQALGTLGTGVGQHDTPLASVKESVGKYPKQYPFEMDLL